MLSSFKTYTIVFILGVISWNEMLEKLGMARKRICNGCLVQWEQLAKHMLPSKCFSFHLTAVSDLHSLKPLFMRVERVSYSYSFLDCLLSICSFKSHCAMVSCIKNLYNVLKYMPAQFVWNSVPNFPTTFKPSFVTSSPAVYCMWLIMWLYILWD